MRSFLRQRRRVRDELRFKVDEAAEFKFTGCEERTWNTIELIQFSGPSLGFLNKGFNDLDLCADQSSDAIEIPKSIM